VRSLGSGLCCWWRHVASGRGAKALSASWTPGGPSVCALEAPLVFRTAFNCRVTLQIASYKLQDSECTAQTRRTLPLLFKFAKTDKLCEKCQEVGCCFVRSLCNTRGDRYQ
jgi:hypothetical protein